MKTVKGVPVDVPSEGGGPGGNATGEDLFPGKLKTTTWKVLVIISIIIVLAAISVIIF